MPYVADAKNTRLLPAVPVVDSVPLMVCWALKVTVVTPANDDPVTVRLLKVFAPVTVRNPASVEVNETLLKVKPVAATEIEDVDAVKLSCEPPALKVKLVVVSAVNDAVLTIDEFNVKALALAPLAEIDTTLSV
jgi:hypothetical protein